VGVVVDVYPLDKNDKMFHFIQGSNIMQYESGGMKVNAKTLLYV
jgi:hypothetical protein